MCEIGYISQLVTGGIKSHKQKHARTKIRHNVEKIPKHKYEPMMPKKEKRTNKNSRSSIIFRAKNTN